MIDLHSHILAGFDHGSESFAMSLAMARIANQTGTRQLVATPHIKTGGTIPDWEEIVVGSQELQCIARQINIDIVILPGAEITAYPEVLDLLTGPGPYCINCGRYMLVEFPASVLPLYADEFFFTLQLRGITPIIAHPERHSEIMNEPFLLKKYIERGVLIQMNGASLTGQCGRKVKAAAEFLLKKDMVHCIGSDAHGDIHRSPNLLLARRRILEIQGESRAREILVHNPACIIGSKDLKNSCRILA